MRLCINLSHLLLQIFDHTECVGILPVSVCVCGGGERVNNKLNFCYLEIIDNLLVLFCRACISGLALVREVVTKRYTNAKPFETFMSI